MGPLRLVYTVFSVAICAFASAAAPPAGEAMDPAAVGGLAGQLHQSEGWAEAVLDDGAVKTFKVEAVDVDSIRVMEVFGALHTRPASYALAQVHSLRDLGPNRIPVRRAVFGARKSLSLALGLEAAVPGLGYLYAGQGRMALAMWGVTGAAVATAVLTGEDGAAGWVPLGVWIKWASLGNLHDDVQAMNRANRQGMALELAPSGRGAWAGRVAYRF